MHAKASSTDFESVGSCSLTKTVPKVGVSLVLLLEVLK